MELVSRILGSVLMLCATYLGWKHGWAGIAAKKEALHLFGQWGVSKPGVMAIGFFTLSGVVLMLIPKTFFVGNFLTATIILCIMCLHLADRNLQGALLEIPFLLMSLLIIYLGHPMSRIADTIIK